MTKKNVMITIDEVVWQSAKDKGLNISNLAEDALRQINASFVNSVLPENCLHKWSLPFCVSTGLAKQCLKCNVIHNVMIETYKETMERADNVK